MISVGSFEELWNIEQDRAENDRQKILGQSSSNRFSIIGGLLVINWMVNCHISEIMHQLFDLSHLQHIINNMYYSLLYLIEEREIIRVIIPPIVKGGL